MQFHFVTYKGMFRPLRNIYGGAFLRKQETGKSLFVVLCAIWDHSYNLKNVKNTHGGALLLVKLQAEAVLNRATHHILQNVPSNLKRS